MLVFRSLALGLLGTCVMLLAVRPPYEVRITQQTVRAVPAQPPTSASIVDVAPSVSHVQVAALLHLAAGEHVLAIDDVAVRDDVEAGARLAGIAMGPNRFVDLTVAGLDGSRRVLVLFH
ncbi:MAG: hypothetical protein JWO36_1447 [Myxococcales bacterium]|nr:hypothetical protein [Myxococcales bacterium]